MEGIWRFILELYYFYRDCLSQNIELELFYPSYYLSQNNYELIYSSEWNLWHKSKAVIYAQLLVAIRLLTAENYFP